MDFLRDQGITSAATLAALQTVPREAFLPSHQRARAYEDRALAIGHGQTCSQPWIVAAVVQALDLSPGSRVLEVGAGSGYMAAVLRAAGAGRVIAIELRPALAARARSNLDRAGVTGVVVQVGDGRLGAPGQAPFQAVVVSAATARVPPQLLAQVAPAGRLICPVSDSRAERLWCLERQLGGWRRRDLGPCRFVPLLGEDTDLRDEPSDAPPETFQA